MSRVVRVACCLLSLLTLTTAAAAQVNEELLGRWVGSGGDDEGVELLVERGFVSFEGVRVPCAEVEPGVLLLGDDNYSERIGYQLRAGTLILKQGDVEARFRRVEGPPAVPVEPAGDPFARTFAGDEIALVLEGSAVDGYRGQLHLEGVVHPVTARADGESLAGEFGEPQRARAFRGTLKGDELTLVIDRKRYALRGEALLPPELEGVYAGATSPYEDPHGWFRFDMPRGWSVLEIGDEGLSLNLGLPPSPAPEAFAGLLWGLLDESDQNRPVAEVIEKYVPTLREALRAQGLVVDAPAEPIGTYRGKDVPCGVVTFHGHTVSGVPCHVWSGGILKRSSWIFVSGVYSADVEEKYLPKLKRILVSLEPRPPVRNPELERLLIRRTFSSSQYGKITKSAHHASYTFSAGNTVVRRLMSNIISQPGLPGSSTDSERVGRYEVCGDVLYLFFETGQSVGFVTLEGGQVVGFRIGTAQYR